MLFSFPLSENSRFGKITSSDGLIYRDGNDNGRGIKAALNLVWISVLLRRMRGRMWRKHFLEVRRRRLTSLRRWNRVGLRFVDPGSWIHWGDYTRKIRFRIKKWWSCALHPDCRSGFLSRVFSRWIMYLAVGSCTAELIYWQGSYRDLIWDLSCIGLELGLDLYELIESFGENVIVIHFLDIFPQFFQLQFWFFSFSLYKYLFVILAIWFLF